MNLKQEHCFFLGDYEEAYETGRKALSFFKGDEKDEELSDISQLMVGICTALNRHDEAVKYGLQSLDIRRTTAGENSQKESFSEACIRAYIPKIFQALIIGLILLKSIRDRVAVCSVSSSSQPL